MSASAANQVGGRSIHGTAAAIHSTRFRRDALLWYFREIELAASQVQHLIVLRESLLEVRSKLVNTPLCLFFDANQARCF